MSYRIIAGMGCIFCAVDTINSALSVTNHAYSVLGWLNKPFGLFCAAIWIVSGVRVMLKGTEEVKP